KSDISHIHEVTQYSANTCMQTCLGIVYIVHNKVIALVHNTDKHAGRQTGRQAPGSWKMKVVDCNSYLWATATHRLQQLIACNSYLWATATNSLQQLLIIVEKIDCY